MKAEENLKFDMAALYRTNIEFSLESELREIMQLSMLCPRGGGGPRDRVGTLNVRAHPT